MKLYGLHILSLVCLPLFATAQVPDTAKPKKEITIATVNITADDVIRKYINAIGGEKVLTNIKNVKLVRTATVQQVPITITELRKAPDQMKIMIEGMDMVFQKVVVGKDSAYQEYMGRKAMLSPAEIMGTRAEADLLAKLTPGKYNVQRAFKGMAVMDSVNTYVIEETDATGKTYAFYYDARTGLLIKKIGSEKTPPGVEPPAIIVTATTYSDYREVEGSGGYKVPWVVKQQVGEQMTTISTIKTAEVNKKVEDKEFN